MGSKSGLVVTGVQEVDGNLFEFERVVLPAELRKGTRDSAKLVLEEYRVECDRSFNIVEQTIEGGRAGAATGAMRDAAVVRAIPRSRVRIGHTVKILAERLYALYAARGGRPKKRFFYPAVVELGSQHVEARAPLRGSLYDNANAIRTEFSKSMLRAINHPKIKRKK